MYILNNHLFLRFYQTTYNNIDIKTSICDLNCSACVTYLSHYDPRIYYWQKQKQYDNYSSHLLPPSWFEEKISDANINKAYVIWLNNLRNKKDKISYKCVIL